MQINVLDPSLWRYTSVIGTGGTLLSQLTPNGHAAGTGHISPLSFECDVKPNDRPFAMKFYDNMFISHVGLSENLNISSVNKIIGDLREEIKGKHYEPKLILVGGGTDALEKLGRKINKRLLKLILENNIRIILTGANIRLSRHDTDGWKNLKFCFTEGHQENLSPGVYIGFHGKLIPIELAVKELFNSKEMNFTSYLDNDYISSLQIQSEQSKAIIQTLKTQIGVGLSYDSDEVMLLRANVIRNNLNELRKNLDKRHPKLVLVVLYHSSTANADLATPQASVARLIDEYRKKGIIFLAITENLEPVNLTPEAYETSVALRNSGLIPLGNMNLRVAMAKLLMCKSMSPKEVIDTMTTNIAGEFTGGSIDRSLVEAQKAFYL